MLNFQDMIAKLTSFWAEQGCLVHQGYDLEVGAGTFNPATFLRCLGPEPYSAVYVEPSRRPKDGRYGLNPNRLQFYHQMQVILKPSPANILDLYIQSLKEIGLKLNEHDIRFVHDDWENPTIGAWGLGWEIWLDGMEVTQFTYFQAVGGVPVKPVSGEITYGLERLAMYLQGVDSFFDLKWNDSITYGEIFQRNEYEWSHHNFHAATTEMWLRHFDDFERESEILLKKNLPIPAYDFVMKASHAFNILDARGVISVTERTGYITRIRNLAKKVAEGFMKSREDQNFPLLKYIPEPLQTPVMDAIASNYDPTKKEDFLLEIGSEELPATFVPVGMQGLENALKKLFKEHDLKFDDMKIFGSPRRLSAIVKGLPEGTSSQKIEKKGPPISAAFNEKGAPTEIGLGFFRSLHHDPLHLKDITAPFEIRKVKEVDYLFASHEKQGIATKNLLSAHLPSLILGLDFPKKMHWGTFDVEFARPIRSLLALYGKEMIPFSIADVTSSNKSFGHRQLAPVAITIDHPDEYLAKLRKSYVMVDHHERKEVIRKELRNVETRCDGKVVSEERVLPQVLHLVEWPFIDICDFDPKFLMAPKEILISEMIEHQKYFPLSTKNGDLLPHFVICANNTPSAKIRHGNQKALAPRLADGLFLYEEDLKTPFEDYADKLKNVTFQKDLGSVAQKVKRLVRYVEILSAFLPTPSLEWTCQAAKLCKADLVTGLVGEFPELQGTVGKFYAEKAGLPKEIALAIEEHWMPRGEKAPLPSSPIGVILSIAEKIDNLLGCFCLRMIPTSSSDPYALRRQGFGVIKMLLEAKCPFPLEQILSRCLEVFLENPELDPKVKAEIEPKKVIEEIKEFLINRARTLFGEEFEKDEIEAVLTQGSDDFYKSYSLLKAIADLRKHRTEEFFRVHQLHTRVKKILMSQKDTPPLRMNPQFFKEESEKILFEKIESFKKKGKTQDFEKIFSQILELEHPVANLFDHVKILDDDVNVRGNRLILLKEVRDFCESLCDFDKIQEKAKAAS